MSTKVYVGNLSYDTTADTLRTLFAQYGEVVSVNVISDRETGRSKGFAFVEMADETAAEAAIAEVNGKAIDGRSVRADVARPQAPRTGDRGSFRGGERRGPPREGRDSRW